jgi:hypothetical protein
VLSPQAMLSQVSDILESVHKIQVSSQRQHFFQAMSPFSRCNWKHSIHCRENYSNIRSLQAHSPVHPQIHHGHHCRPFVTFFEHKR